MKLFLLAFLCAGACFGSLSRSSTELFSSEIPEKNIQDTRFQSGREYNFYYDGQLSSGVAGASKQHSAQRIRALVTLVFKSDSQALLKLSNVRMAKLNREINNPRKVMPLQAFEQVPIEESLKSALESVVKFNYNNGIVEEVVFDAQEQPWSANIKRSVLNLLQINLQQRNSLDARDETRWTNNVHQNENTDIFYRVMEKSLEGECETLYNVRPLTRSSTPIMNVTKSINFEKCQQRPMIQYNFRFSEHCPTCDSKYNDDEKFVKSSTVIKYNITGTKNSFMIDSARVESEYILTPFNEEANVFVTYVNQTLVLFKTGPIETQLHEPRNPIRSDSNMIFTLDWDIAYEKFHMTGEDMYHQQLHKSQKGANKIELTKQYLRKTVQKMKQRLDEDVPRNFMKLVSLMRMCKENELEEIIRHHESASVEEQKRVKILIPQALGTCGTKVCVKLLSHKIRQGEMPTLRAVMAIKSLLHNRVVSKEIVEELIHLAESEQLRQSPFLKRQTWLIIGSMANALCSVNDDKLALEIKEQSETYCTREWKEKFVNILLNKLNQETKWEDKVMMLKTIANAGLDISVVKLEQIIRQLDRTYPTYVRFEAISALRLLTKTMQKKLQRVLVPVVMNRREYPSIRSAASYILLQTLPDRPILDQLTRSLISEPSRQFASFLYTQMDSYANSTNPCEQRFATDLKLSLRNAKKISTGLGYSLLKRLSMHNERQYIGADVDVDAIFTNTSAMPRHLSTSLHLNVLGLWKKNLASISFFNDGLLEQLSRQFIVDSNLFSREQFDSVLRQHPRETFSEYERELDDIFGQKLNIRHRDYSNEYENTPKAYLSTMYKSQSNFFLPISKQSLMELIQDSTTPILEWKQKLERGISIDYGTVALLHDIHYKIPTSLGIPLMMTMKTPLAWNIDGKLRAVMETSKTFKVEADLKPTAIATFITDLKTWTPIVQTGVKLISKAKLHAPIDAELKLNIAAEPKSIKLFVKPTTEKRDLLVIESRPITYTREWQRFIRNEQSSQDERTVYGEELNRVYTKNVCQHSSILNVEYCVRVHVQNTVAKKVKGSPIAPLAGLNKIVVTAQPGLESSQPIEIELNGKLSSLSESDKPSFSQHQPFSWESTDSLEYAQSQESVENSAEILQQYRQYPISSKGLKAHGQLNVRTGSSQRLNVEMTAVVDANKRYSKLSARMQTHHRQPFQACFDSEMMYPETPAFVEDVKQKKIIANAKLHWGQQCSSDNYIRITSEIERSNQQAQWEREQDEFETFQTSRCTNKAWCSPLTQEDFVEKVAQMNKYRVEIDYRNVPDTVKNYTNKFYRFLKNYYYWQTDVNQINVNNPQNKIRAEIVLDAYSKQRVNVTVKTPKETVRMQDLPLSRPITFAVNQKKSFAQQFADFIEEDHEQAECSITGRNGWSRKSQVETFDGVKYSAPFETDCWIVLAKDCSSSKPKFVVMTRKSPSAPEAKEVKIITRHARIELRPDSQEYESVKVILNGRPINPETEETPAGIQITKENSNIVSVRLSKLVDVDFDGYAINIKLFELFRGQQCGLCGHYDLESADEFRTPDFTSERDLRKFYLSYIVADATCRRPTNVQDVCLDENCDRFQIRSEETSRSTSRSIEEFDNDNDMTTERTQPKIKVLERDDQICFSQNPVPQCDDDSYPINVQKKAVPYVCFEQNSFSAEQYELQARYGEADIVALKSKPVSFVNNEYVPEKCKEFHRN